MALSGGNLATSLVRNVGYVLNCVKPQTYKECAESHGVLATTWWHLQRIFRARADTSSHVGVMSVLNEVV